jgi:rRNA maturation RNase YbeY
MAGLRVDVRSRAGGAPAAARVRSVLARAGRTAGAGSSGVSVLFCADSRMRALNRRWRGEDRPTDVLAFPADSGLGTRDSRLGEGFLGDIVISVPYADRQARRREESRSREIDRLLVHGLLHLMGYDHEADDGEMNALERRVRRRLGIEERRSATARPARSAAR